MDGEGEENAVMDGEGEENAVMGGEEEEDAVMDGEGEGEGEGEVEESVVMHGERAEAASQQVAAPPQAGSDHNSYGLSRLCWSCACHRACPQYV